MLVVSGCAGIATVSSDADYANAALAMMKADFKPRGPATMERMVQQDEAQELCSRYPGEVPKNIESRIEQAQMKLIAMPADGKYLGDWKQGEAIAQNGRGMQSSDAAGSVNGGNCYACHQMTKEEISFGNIGPSLYHYGKLRGQSEEIAKYTWGKIYNAQAYKACSSMPRFGHNRILTEGQLKDVMALLLDPASPVNK
jgi:sulfur-oxidizing protein SoxX